MTKYIAIIAATIAALISASCDGLSVDLNNDAFQGSYSAKGGMVIMPKIPSSIQLIEPAK